MRAFEVLQHPYSYESVKLTCEKAPLQMLSTAGDRCTYSAVEYLKARVDRLVGVLQNPNFLEMFNARSDGMKQALEKKYFEYKLDDEKNFPRGLVSPEVARKGKDGGGVASGRGSDVKDKPTGMKKTDGPGGGGRTPVGNRRGELSTRDGERGTTTPRGKGPGMRGRSPDRPYGHKRYRSPSPPPRGYESGGGREREDGISRRIAIDRCQGTEIENPALAVVASEGSPMMGSAGLGRLLSVAVGVTADRLSGLDVRKIAMVSEKRQMSTTLKGLCACKRC